MKTNAIRIDAPGGPKVMRYSTIDLPEPKAGEIRVRHGAIGVNFIDTYHRSGLYTLPLPTGLGMEAAGKVEALGENVSDFKIGERVAYASGSVGAYAQAHNILAVRAVKIPDSISDEQAAAALLKGLTAQYLLRQTFRIERGQTILWHAAAGGVGLIATQWAKHFGVTVIGTVGSDEKASLARAHGCDYILNSRNENIAARVYEITEGKKLPVVYDGVGKDTFTTSLDCLARRGLLVSFGNASGAVDGFELRLLSSKGSLYVTRPTLIDYTPTSESLRTMAAELFDAIQTGIIKIDIYERYALKDAAQAHFDLETRKTTGASLLIP